MLEILYFAGAFVASAQDLQTGRVSNLLLLSMLALGLLHASLTGPWDSLLFGGLFFAFGAPLWASGRFGMADAALMGLAGLFVPGLGVDFLLALGAVGPAYMLLYALLTKQRPGWSLPLRARFAPAVPAAAVAAMAI